MQPVVLPGGEEVVWDGRYAATAGAPGFTIRPVAGVAARLPRVERERLRAGLPAGLRRGLPALVDARGAVTSPVLTPNAGVSIASLVGDRFRAAAGLVDREPL
jgi:tRNA(Ile)-lysidine synthase